MKKLLLLATACAVLGACKSRGTNGTSGTEVIMKTSLGDIKVQLFPDKAPITVANFLSHVDSGFYDGTIYHRVMPTFMIQGGGLTEGLVEKNGGAPIKNESNNGLSNERGTIAMARTSNPDSAVAQFFINVVNNPGLDYKPNSGYAVFGKVVDGMDVVDRIKNVPTGTRNGMQNVPETNVVIQSIRRAP